MNNDLKLVINDLREIAKSENVDLRVTHARHSSASILSNRIDVSIVPSSKLSYWANIERIVSAFFHELSHVLAFRAGKFRLYHSMEKANLSKATKRAIKRTAWRAERYVDAMAKDLQSYYYPTLKYWAGYRTNKDRQWLNAYLANI